jgi:Mg-chelatase subunit ChlD
MRTTSFWALKRRLYYGALFASVIGLFSTYIYLTYLYIAPTCFDGVQNATEIGVDCGGACVRICAFTVEPPKVKWARSFKVSDGQYNAVAYVENSNRIAASPEVKYKFTLYDETGLILEKTGTTILPPDSVYPIFEGRIFTGNRVPTKTFLEIEPPEIWQPATSGREQFTIVNRELISADSKPKLNATVRNNSLEEAKEVEVVATIFDAEGTALASSETFVENFGSRSDTEVVFTWPEPLATTMRSCEIPTDVSVAIDVSGSMNNDGADPPQPLTAVKEAAQRFVNRLNTKDQVSLTTFASEATLNLPLSNNFSATGDLIRQIIIEPKEETGNTNTGDGLLIAGEELISARHNLDARKVLVLLTDGLATAPDPEPEVYALNNANLVKGAGIEIYTIGLGANVNMDFVRAVATNPTYAYQALTATDIDRIYQTITASLCEEGAAIIDIIPKTGASFTPLGNERQ